MPPPFGMRGPTVEMLLVETVYFLIIFALCMIIYFRTKPIYDLTKHKGVFFFRNVFLFFGLTYFARFVFLSFVLLREADLLFPKEVYQLSLILVGYFSTMAILCLVVTAALKNIKTDVYRSMFWLSLLSIVIAVLTFGKWSHQILIVIHGVLLLFAVVYVFAKAHGKSTKSFLSYNKLTYLLLFVFWILNVITFTRGWIPPDFKIPMYILNVAVFFWVFWRVHKRVPNVKKKR